MNGAPQQAGTVEALAAALAAGRLDARELAARTLARIGERDPQLHAFVQVLPERAGAAAEAAGALLAAGAAPGPLCGVPFAVKDLFDLRGTPTGAGTRLRAGHRAASDAAAVARLCAAGMVPVGKTHTVQFAYGGVGINHDLGTPVNPWAAEPHVPGGSSSGSAVAVAAGLVPAALGTDTGGSVRIPAALCGVTGLKTTVGRVSRAGVYPLSPTLDSVGPLARTVRDAGLLLEALAGPDPADPSTLAHPPEPFLAEIERGVEGLRIGLAEGVLFEDCDPEVSAAVREAAEVFARLGARVEALEFEEAREARDLNPRGLVIAAEAYAVNRAYLEEQREALDPVVAGRMAQGAAIAAHEYLATMRAREAAAARAAARLAEYDALLCPTTQIPARALATADADPASYREHNLRYLRNTAIGNLLGLCALSVPCGLSAAGLPLGLMIYAAPFAEARLLRIGHAYQQATDWHLREPPG